MGRNEVINSFMVTEVYIKQNGFWKMGSLSFSHLPEASGSGIIANTGVALALRPANKSLIEITKICHGIPVTPVINAKMKTKSLKAISIS